MFKCSCGFEGSGPEVQSHINQMGKGHQWEKLPPYENHDLVTVEK